MSATAWTPLFLILALAGCAETDAPEALSSTGGGSSLDDGGDPSWGDGGSGTDEPGDGSGDDPDDGSSDESGEVDDAAARAFQVPTEMACGGEAQARVTIENTGTTTWTRDGGYKLGAVSDDDPFYDLDTRVWLPDGVSVAPGETWDFDVPMIAPEAAGDYTTDWQMVREHVAWFGESVAAQVSVECDVPTGAWVDQLCARNGDEICDDERFRVESGVRYALHCSEAEGGISYVAGHTGPTMSDGVDRCQGWEESGQDAWDHLDYIESFVCDTPGEIVEVDLSDWVGADVWMGSHDHPDGGGHMTSTCVAIWEE